MFTSVVSKGAASACIAREPMAGAEEPSEGFVLAVRAVQGVLLALPVPLALCATVGTQRRWVRASFGLSRRALCWFRVSLGVVSLLDLASRARELRTWLADDGILSRSRKLEARANRDARISSITQALYTGFGQSMNDGRNWATADYGGE